MGVAEADLDDACQEVFLIAHRKLPEFEGRSSPLVWLLGISVRVAAARRRRVQNTREVPSEGLPEPAGPEVASSGLERSEARVLLDRMLEGLDEAKRAVFVLYELEELSMPEISELLGCPLQTAYSRLHAARRQLEAAIASRLAREEVP